MDVKVSAKIDENGNVDWDIDGKKPKKSVLEFPANSSDHDINFKLHDSTGRKMKFDASSPFWAHESSSDQCPPPGSSTDQTRVVSCTDKDLSVANSNSRKCEIQYQLNVVDENSNSYAVDPIIRNGGNG